MLQNTKHTIGLNFDGRFPPQHFSLLWSSYKNNIVCSPDGSSGGSSFHRHVILFLLDCKLQSDEMLAWAVKLVEGCCAPCCHLWLYPAFVVLGCKASTMLSTLSSTCATEGTKGSGNCNVGKCGLQRWIKGEGWTSQAGHPAYQSLCSLNCPTSHSSEQVLQGGERLGLFNYCNPFDLMHSWVCSLLVKIVLQVGWIRYYFQSKYFGYCSLAIS